MPPAPSEAPKRAVFEAETMKRIAQLLDALPDVASRSRVLQWSMEHYYGAPAVSSPASDDPQRLAVCSGGGGADPALTIGDDVFETPSRSGEAARADEDRVEDWPEDETIHYEDLAVEGVVFDRQAIDNNDLAIDGGDIDPAVRDTRPTAGFESTVREFVAAFQQLAVAWQAA